MNGTVLKMWGMWRTSVLCMAFILSQGTAMAALSFLSSFSVGQAYTDNLFFNDSNRKSDFGTFVGPNFTLQYDNPDIVIGATYYGRVALFINNSNANTYIQNANILLDLPFLTKRYRGLTVTIDESMNFTPQLDAFSLSGARDETFLRNGEGAGGNRGLGGGGGGNAENAPGGFQGGVGRGTQGVFTNRADAFLNNAGITLGYAWAPGVQPSLGYTNQYRHFFSGGFQDSIRHGVFLALGYAVNQQTTVTPSYSYTRVNFLGDSTQDTAGDKASAHGIQLGISHIWTPSVRSLINGGVTFSKQEGAEEFEGGMTEQINNTWQKNFTGSASLSKTYGRGSVNLAVQQNIGFGGGLAAQNTRTRTVTGSIGHALSQRMNGSASLGWAKNDSTDGNAFDANTYRIQAGLAYTFTTWLFGNLQYSHIEQRSSGSAADDLRVDSIFLALTAVADPWVLMR